MTFVDALFVIVFIVQAPWGEGNGVVWNYLRYHTPRLAWILSAKEGDGMTAVQRVVADLKVLCND
jgi:hypothetical protein